MTTSLYKGRYLELLDHNGWEYINRPNATGVVDLIALTDDGEILFVEQHRVPFDGPVIELPAGLVGDEDASESIASAAARELEEETGYRAASLIQVAKGSTSPGQSTEEMTVFLATGLTKVGEGGGVDDEDITLHKVPLGDAHSWLEAQVAKGKKIALRVYSGLYFAQRHLG
jgi:ADP-ribose pyrophosphatase